MAIQFVEPDANPTRTYPGGIKIIRLHEFLGPARGTLSTVSDPWSLCGTVVRDAQTISYSGTNPNKTIDTNLKANATPDTIRMSLTDLSLDPYFGYRIYISARCEGEFDPSVAGFDMNFYQIGSRAAEILVGRRDSGLSFFSTFGGNFYAPKPLTNPHYKILLLVNNVNDAFFESGNIFVVRAGTGTGGNLVWFLDCLYLVPNAANFFTSGNPYANSDFRQIMWNDQHEPLYDRATSTYITSRDDATLDWTDGLFSVMNAVDAFGVGNQAAGADFQDGEHEKTSYNVYGGFGTINSAFDTITDVMLIVGSQHTESHEIDRDDFDRTVTLGQTPYLGASQKNRIWKVVNNHPFQAAGPNSGFSIDGTQLRFNEGKYDGIWSVYYWATPDPEYTPSGDYASLSFGEAYLESGTGANTSQGHENLRGMNSCIMEVMVTTDHLLNASFQMMAGFNNGGAGNFYGLILDRPASGVFGSTTASTVLKGGIGFLYAINQTKETDTWLDGPDVITTSYSANTWVHIKVEFMWHRIRGKAWIDGDTEPASWQWDAKLNVPGSPTPVFYPYNDLASQHGLSMRSQISLFPMLVVRYFPPIETLLGNEYLSHQEEGLRLTSTFFKNFVLTHEAYGEIPGNMNLRMEKFSGVDYGLLSSGPESQRMVVGDYATYTNDTTKEGFGLTLFKDAGSPDTQCVVLSNGFQKIRRGVYPIAVHEFVNLK